MATLKYERQGTLSALGARSADLVDKSMNLYLKVEEETPVHMLQFFKKEHPTTANFKLTTIGQELTLPMARDDKDPFPLDTPAPGYSADWDYATFQNGVASTKALQQFDRSGELSFILGGLPKSFRTFYEYGMANVIETGASTTGADAVFGFSASHPQRGAGAGTWSNLESAAVLSSTSANSMWVNMANRKNAQGFATHMRLKKLIVPTAYREKAMQLASSERVPESNVNAVNAYKGIEYEVCETLVASSTAWYGWGDLPEQQYGLHLIEWNAPTITGLGIDTNYPLVTNRFHGYCRVVFALSIPANMHYNAGA